jgi:hypothetical protein
MEPADLTPSTYESFLYRILSKGDPGSLQFATACYTSITVTALASGVRVSDLIVGVTDQSALCDVLGELYDAGLCLLSIEQNLLPCEMSGMGR